MKAIALVPGTTQVSLVDRPEPNITAPDEIKIKITQVGICGTDREEAAGGRADAPPGSTDLVLGHEMFGEVVETGSAVTTVKKGDYAVFTVRRGCGRCAACAANRSDMCLTGHYTERGIKGADGFQAAYVVDKEQYVVKVPESIKEIGVLTEPMSVAAKAVDEAVKIQQVRLQEFDKKDNWLQGKKALVAGIGPIGLMAAFVLRLHGAEVVGMDIVDETTLRARILKEIGGRYIDGRVVQTTDLDDALGQVDFIFEATGIAKLQIQLVDALGINGIYVLSGIPAGERPLSVMVDALMRQMVLKNQVLLGAVNAGIEHYRMAVQFLEASQQQWPGAMQKVITEKVPYVQFSQVLHNHAPDEIKVVVEWT